jgi:N-acetylglutamate synthase-like GNAT family acetyltransferase
MYYDVAIGVARLDHPSEGIVVIRRMAIDIGMQRQGYGRTLLDLLERRALGLSIITLKVHAAEDAVPFYEKLGYAVWRGTTTLRKSLSGRDRPVHSL